MKKILSLSAICAALIFTSCKRAEVPVNTNCTINQIWADMSNSPTAMFNIVRTGSLITEYNNTLGHRFVFTYDANNNVIKKEEKVNGITEVYLEYTYNSNNKITKQKYYSVGNGGYYYSLDIIYDGNQKIIQAKGYNEPTHLLESTYNFIWTNDNITACNIVPAANGPITRIRYTNDAVKENYCKNLFTNFIAMDLYVGGDEFALLPLFANKNSLTSVYEVDAAGNDLGQRESFNYIFSPTNNSLLKEIRYGANPYYKFHYDCE